MRGYPSERLRREIIQTHSARLGFTPPATTHPFSAKIVSVRDFLSATTFAILRAAAERQIQAKRVRVPVHKQGATISYHDLHFRAPEIVAFYLLPQFHEWCSAIIGQRVATTPLNDLSSCSLLIYDRPNDHIGWHYDYDFYGGRHFTALLSLWNDGAGGDGASSANLVVLRDEREVVIPTPPNTLILFEGAHVYHRVTPLGEGERRVMMSMTLCTDPSATALQRVSRRVKDIAYFGLRALWT